MSVSFFIAPYKADEWEGNKSDLHIDPEWYREHLEKDWSGIKFYDIDKVYHSKNPGIEMLWGLLEPNAARIIGKLHNDKKVISLDNCYEEFFVWHRSIISSKFQLYLFSSSSLNSFELSPKVSVEDIWEFIRK